MTWKERALALIAEIHADTGDCTLAELKAALRPHAYNYHGGTSWGKKQWSAARRAYFQKHFRDEWAPNKKAQEAAGLFADDIIFPFRDRGRAD